MQIKTITTAAGVNEIDFGNDDSQTTAHYYWFKNLSDSTLYVSAMPNPVAGEDNVAELSAKGAASVETDEGKVYVLGAGKVEIHRTNSKFCPFELPSTGSGGGGGGSITVDSELSETSENPLQNKATTAAINEVKSDLVKTQEDVAENAAALSTKSDINHIHDITASGNPVTLANLQGEVPFSEMAVSGKNLIPFPYYDGNSKTHNGITFTVNSDGSVTANGTATASAIFYISTNYTIKKGIYTLSGCPQSNSNTDYVLQFATGDWSFKISDFGNGATTQIGNDINLQIFRIAISNGVVCDNLVFRPQLELGTTPTAYEPPITGRELQVNVSGKNLMKNIVESGTMSGVSVTKNADNSITLNGTPTSDLWLLFDAACPIIKGKTYTFSSGLTESTYMVFGVRSEDDNISYLGTRTYGSFVSPVTGMCRVRAFAGKDYSLNNLTIYPQLELGSIPTEYEPYHGAEYTITPDSNPYVIPNDIRQVEGLNNISVSAGELSVIGVQKNAAVKRIWDNMGMDLLFDGVIAADNPALIDIKGYSNIVVSVASKYSDDIINTGTIIMAVSDIIKSISVGIKRYFSTGSRASIINITGTINNCAIVLEPYNTGDTILNCKIYGIK